MLVEMTLYHATAEKCLVDARSCGRLFGRERVVRSRGANGGSNLTTDPSAAVRYAREYWPGSLRRGETLPKLVLLTFSVPTDLVKPVGRTRLIDCPEFATTLTVPPERVPDNYFSRWEGGCRAVNRDIHVAQAKAGKLRFYQVPFAFLTSVDPIDW